MTIQLTQRFFISCLSSALAFGASTALGTPADGMVIGATKIVDHGPDAQRYTIVLVAEGYQQSEMTLFAQDAQYFVDYFFNTPPFNTNCSAFNFYRIDVASSQSGADDPATCEDGSTGSGTAVNTYFDATFCSGGNVRRLLSANAGTVINVANAQVPGWDTAVVIVNTTEYGGSGGGQVGVTSLAGSGWPDIAIHEFGHAAFGLGDEYEYYLGCGVDPAGTRDNHPSVEPTAANVTVETNPSLVKWRGLFYPSIAIPTTVNSDCTQCDPQADPFPGEIRVGLYHGGDYYHCGGFRPVFDCKFRHLSASFCPVCIQRMLQVLQPFMPPNGAPIANAGGPYVAECTGTTSVTLDGSQSSDPDCNHVTFTWTGPFVGGTATSETPTVQFNGLGAFTVNLAVNDGVATTTTSTTVTIHDTTPPLIHCPADIVKPTDPGGCQVVVAFTISATDACDVSPAVVSIPPSGSVFPNGTTTVTSTATDASGNAASCSFKVTVQDREPPKVSCVPGRNSSGRRVPSAGKNPHSGENPDGFYQLIATDNCDPHPKIYVKDSASSFVAGPLASGADLKIVQAPGTTPRRRRGPGVITAEIHLKGDALVYSVDADGNTSTPIRCLLPPPPK